MSSSGNKSRLNKRLIKSARKGDLAGIEKALDDGAEIGAKSSYFNWSLDALGTAALHGRLDAVKLLLDRGADINARDRLGETALISALLRTQLDVAEYLIDKGADVTVEGVRRRPALLLAAGLGTSGRKIVEKLTGKKDADKKDEASAVEKPQPPAGTPDQITFTRQLGDRTLEDIFDFAARERITFIRAQENGPVEAVTRESFENVGDKASLRRAFDEHVRKGGKSKETEIFPGALGKVSKLKGGTP